MAKLVGIPCGVGKLLLSVNNVVLGGMCSSLTNFIAVKQVLDGTITEKGILAPVTPEFNKSLMVELKEKHGFVFCPRA